MAARPFLTRRDKSEYESGMKWLAVLLLSLGLNVPVVAQDAAMNGVFVNTAPSDSGIRSAVDKAAREFSFVIRPIARSRLNKLNAMINRIEIASASDTVSITLGRTKPVVATPGGPAVKWSREDGDVFDVTLAWQGATLVQTFTSPEGSRINRYTLAPDKQSIKMDVVLTSPQLKSPMSYQLSFTREAR